MIQATFTLLAITGLYYWSLNLEAETTGLNSKEYTKFKRVTGTSLKVAWIGFILLSLILA